LLSLIIHHLVVRDHCPVRRYSSIPLDLTGRASESSNVIVAITAKPDQSSFFLGPVAKYLENSNQMCSQSGRRSWIEGPTSCSNATDSTATSQRQPMHYLVSA